VGGQSGKTKERILSRQNILITGGAGFLGRHLIDILKAESLSITILDLKPVSEFESQVTNIAEPNLRLNNRDFDTVYHLAGLAHFVPKSAKDSESFFRVNRDGMKNLLNALIFNKPPKNFLFISTVAVYGIEQGENIREDITRAPLDPYGKSKRDAEDILLEWSEQHNVNTSIIRLPLLVGKNPPGNLGAMIRAINRGYYFNVAGGKARRSMVLASEVANILPKAAECGGTFHLTDGHHPTYAEISNAIGLALGLGKTKNLVLLRKSCSII